MIKISTSHTVLLTGCALWLAACAQSPAPLSVDTATLTADDGACQVTAPFSTVAFDDRFEREVSRLMTHMMDRGMAPGAVIQIRQNGKTVFDKAYGYADLDSRKPMETDSLFRIFSMTKPITSMAALRLVDEGRLELDAPIHRYLPEFADVEVLEVEAMKAGVADGSVPPIPTRRATRPPTVRDLLRHTSGLTYLGADPDNPLGLLYAQAGVPAARGVDGPPREGRAPVQDNDAFISRIASLPLKHDPGAAWSYGNSTDVLGVIVSQVSGETLGDYMRDNFFEPLGMNEATFTLPADRAASFTTAYNVPQQSDPGAAIDDLFPIDALEPRTPVAIDPYSASLYMTPATIEFGGAGLVMDADDYLNFTTALMDEERRPVSSALWGAATQDQLTSAARNATQSLGDRGFGLGFAIKLGETHSAASSFPQCGLFWAGAASTYFWIDEETQTTGVLMTQVLGGDVRSYFSELLSKIYNRPESDGASNGFVID
jgi:CubicO group peptidase (beta-lactamase class C family)